MSTIQERLQIKRVPLDTWNTREQLCLASAVVRSGDQNWMSVSRALKTVGEPNRPPDWYSQKSCAAQYGALLEHVETPKRKKRSSESAVETPQESILKRLTQDRILEIQATITEMNQQYEQLKNEVTEIRSPLTSEDRLKEMWASVEAAKRARERESAKRAAWLKEREEKRARAERNWRPPRTPEGQPTTPTPAPSSPLLTSLLKSSPVTTTPQHISHPNNTIDSISPSACAPTLSMLLEPRAPPAPPAPPASPAPPAPPAPPAAEHAAIEHIKSQLVQLERRLKARTPPPAPPAPPALDIDDIEIKAEDVYAFRDIDLHIPPVATMHKVAARAVDKPQSTPEEEPTPMETDDVVVTEDAIEQEQLTPAPVVQSTSAVHETPVTEVPPTVPVVEVPPEPEVKIAFPEVKFPTLEIKVIQPEDKKVKEEIKEPEVIAEPQKEIEIEKEKEEVVEVNVKQIPPPPPVEEEVSAIPEPPAESAEAEPQPTAEVTAETEPAESAPEPAVETKPEVAETPEVHEPEPPPPSEPLPPPEEVKEEPPAVEEEEKEIEDTPVDVETTVEEVSEDRKDEDIEVNEDSIPLKDMIKSEPTPLIPEADVKVETEDTHTETDDDTPMELSREEEKDGKKRKDYSRKKKSDSRTCSGSESAEASAPESPLADAERQHRLWRKAAMLVYSRLCAHKYASLFLRPISDEEAPGYSAVVKRPIDLSTLRKNIDSGIIRTTAEFQRDILLMFSNALMYNSSEHSVYIMAKEMHEEAVCQLSMLVAAQAHAALEPPPPRRKRRRDASHATAKRPH